MTLEPIANDRKNVTQYIFKNARPILIAFILFVVIVVMTTDIRMETISSLSDLGPEFFILFLCSYGMYICCTDGGVKAGCATDPYKNAVKRFDELKYQIETSYLSKLNDFCVHYINEELRQARMQYLGIACIPYDIYIEKYAKLGKTDIDALTELTSLQRRAIKKANSLRPIRLTPEMILTQGKIAHIRSALATNPLIMKIIVCSVKIVKMSLITICMPLIVLDFIMEPSWIVFAEVCLKLFTVVLNGFDGHKDGYNNITVHTVNYVNNQCSLMQQAIQYATQN